MFFIKIEYYATKLTIKYKYTIIIEGIFASVVAFCPTTEHFVVVFNKKIRKKAVLRRAREEGHNVNDNVNLNEFHFACVEHTPPSLRATSSNLEEELSFDGLGNWTQR